jgi:hypothetical protein
MDIQRHLENSLRIVKEDPIVIIVGGFVVASLNLISLGLLAGPLLGAYVLLMVRILRDNKKPDFNDLFSEFKRFGELFPFCVVSIITIIGFFMFIIPGVLMITWWIYVIMLMADQNMSLGQAMSASKKKVDENGFFMHLVFIFMITVVPTMLINFASAIIPPIQILQILLMPFQCACLVSLYLEQYETVESVSPVSQNVPQAPPATPTPPPQPQVEKEEKGLGESSATPPPPPEKDSE